eukprot:CAMPEP_0196652294 /NCGR_PEP_ID=MMETSP1086-20130531/1524_1 /TAXON_ID=77921 /ORGANISM="Cyanoptyche  gloeocystis , Strain SAG4.97" /LENGTH=56 /DNA_ID=CAMNT_0041982747 /DNA_START=44 /DNA_END=214 /DNA_ORIENTATION=+
MSTKQPRKVKNYGKEFTRNDVKANAPQRKRNTVWHRDKRANFGEFEQDWGTDADFF